MICLDSSIDIYFYHMLAYSGFLSNYILWSPRFVWVCHLIFTFSPLLGYIGLLSNYIHNYSVHYTLVFLDMLVPTSLLLS